MAAIYQDKKRRGRVGMYLAGGVGVFLAAYLPSFILFPARGAPVLSTAAASFILILIAMRFRSVREGLIAGLILGLVAGIASWGANRNRVDMFLANLANPTTQPAPDTQPVATSQPAPTTAPSDEPSLTPEQREQAIRDFSLFRDRLPTICILPNVLLGGVIGLIFARAAVRRKQLTQSPWQ